MDAIIAKYKAKILQRLDQEEPLSDEDLLAINDAIRVLARFEKPSEKADAAAAAPYSPDKKKENSRECTLSIKVSDNNSKQNQDEMESRLRSVLSISNGNTDYV